jgi:hypothetical protein
MTRAALPATPPDRTAARTVATLAALTLAGAALGVASELAGYLPHPWEYLSQLAAPWLVLAFGAGRPWRRARTGAVCGVAVILVGLVAYALFKAVAYGGDSVRPLLGEWPFWAVLAVGFGAAAGAAGALTSARRPALAVLAWAVPLAGLLAEAAAIALGYLLWGIPLALLEVAAALGVATWATRHVRIGPLALATLVLTGVAAVLVPVVQALSPVS